MKFILGITLGTLLVNGLSFATPPPETKEQAEVRKRLQEIRPTAKQKEAFKKIQEYQDAQMRLNMAMLERQKAFQRLQIETEGRMDRTSLLTICANDVAELLKAEPREDNAKPGENNAELRKTVPKLTVEAAKKKVLACELAETEAAAKREEEIRMQTTGGSSDGGSEGVGAP